MMPDTINIREVFKEAVMAATRQRFDASTDKVPKPITYSNKKSHKIWLTWLILGFKRPLF